MGSPAFKSPIVVPYKNLDFKSVLYGGSGCIKQPSWYQSHLKSKLWTDEKRFHDVEVNGPPWVSGSVSYCSGNLCIWCDYLKPILFNPYPRILEKKSKSREMSKRHSWKKIQPKFQKLLFGKWVSVISGKKIQTFFPG